MDPVRADVYQVAIGQPFLEDPAAETAPGFQYCDAEAIPEQHVGASKSGKASTNYPDMWPSTCIEGFELQRMLASTAFQRSLRLT